MHTCLESLGAQRYKDLEIIVVDNQSQDGSMRILSEYPQVKTIYNDENVGFAVGQNQGIAIARGEYILSLKHPKN